MKVGVFRNTDSANDYLRACLPFEAGEKYGQMKATEVWISNLLYEVQQQTDRFKELLGQDIFLIQRLAGESLMRKIKDFLFNMKLKTKIIIDHEDDVFNVSPLSSAYNSFGTKEVKIVHNGKVLHEWKNGVNIDIKKNLRYMDEVKRTIEKADCLTVTTESLANVFRPYHDKIRILPNCVDLTAWNKLPLIRKNPEEIRICWAGGSSHWEDLFMIREPLIEIANKYPNVKILIVGYKPPSMEKIFRPGQMEFHDWVHISAHPYRLAILDPDIALIPLRQTEFSKGKSPIKWIDFSALKVPTITSYITPYREVADLDNGENGIYVEDNDKNGWFKAMEYLINSPTERVKVADRAYETVKKYFDINTQYKQWVNVYREVLNADRRQPSSV